MLRPFPADPGDRGLKQPEFASVAPRARVPRDRDPGLKAALVVLWGDSLPIRRCMVHLRRNLKTLVPGHMPAALGNDRRYITDADAAAEHETRHKGFLPKG